MQPVYRVGIVLLLCALVVVGFFAMQPAKVMPEASPLPAVLEPTGDEPPRADPVAAEPVDQMGDARPDSTRPQESIPMPPLPRLQDSDAWLLEQVANWSLPAVVLQPSDLIARASVVLLNAAAGQMPRRQLAFLGPFEAYSVREIGEKIFVDPVSYLRFELWIDVLESIPPAELAAILRRVQPLVEQALEEVGEPVDMAALVHAVVQRVNQVPVIDKDIELLRPSVMYIYADAELEALPSFEKQLLRMGPQRVSRVQSYVAQFAAAYPAP